MFLIDFSIPIFVTKNVVAYAKDVFSFWTVRIANSKTML
jgi:hypothetical protein